MTFQIDEWMEQFVQKCKDAFADRLCLIGLQGSYQRGEATEHSDIDLVVILDTLGAADLHIYRNLIASMPYAEKACGFCSGKRELMHWPRYDLFQLVNDTRVLYGDFRGLVPALQRQDVLDAIHFGAANLYHEACHSYLYRSDTAAAVCSLLKGTFFILQAIHFYQTQVYISSQKQLLPRLSGVDAELLQLCMNRSELTAFPPQKLDAVYQTLISWCSGLLTFA